MPTARFRILYSLIWRILCVDSTICNRSVSYFLTYCISHIKVVAIATTEKISNGSSTQIDGLVSNYVSPEIHAFNSMWTIFPKFADNRCTNREKRSNKKKKCSTFFIFWLIGKNVKCGKFWPLLHRWVFWHKIWHASSYTSKTINYEK